MNDLQAVKEERLLKASDVARVLSISKALAYRLIQQSLIPAVRINTAVRVRPCDLDAFIERCREELDEKYPE